MTSREKHTQSTCSVTSSLKIKKGSKIILQLWLRRGKYIFPRGHSSMRKAGYSIGWRLLFIQIQGLTRIVVYRLRQKPRDARALCIMEWCDPHSHVMFCSLEANIMENTKHSEARKNVMQKKRERGHWRHMSKWMSWVACLLQGEQSKTGKDAK